METLAKDRLPENLLGIGEERLVEVFAQWGEPPWRAKQVMQWIHHRGVTDFKQMSNLSMDLREKLQQQFCLHPLQVSEEFTSDDGTRKWLIQAGISLIEAVLIPQGSRRTLCVSSQVGCVLACSFCATGRQGFARNLSSAEIVGQLWLVQRALESVGERVSNVVMMGMGEPLLNYDAVVEAMSIMTSDHGYGLSRRRVTLSTAGLVPQILHLAKDSNVALAISLHAPNDALRDKLVPINRKYPIDELLRACREYLEHREGKRYITIEYILISEVNDALEHAHELADRLGDMPCKINLIPYNNVDGLDYQTPSGNRQHAFRRVLQAAGYTVTLRTARGADIAAACGQLAGKVQEITRRQRLINPIRTGA